MLKPLHQTSAITLLLLMCSSELTLFACLANADKTNKEGEMNVWSEGEKGKNVTINSESMMYKRLA